MEKRTCKLCLKTFSNGRALGGHMRSHMIPLSTPPKIQTTPKHQISSSSSSDSEEEEEEEEEREEEDVEVEVEVEDESKALCYELRSNPRKSIRIVDPEFSFALDTGSVIQDRESETESSLTPIRRKSKRCRELSKLSNPDPEQVSSVSDTTPEENVALSLMMLSRDTWSEKDRVDSDDSDEFLGKHRCETCKKVFKSYQALGGHRASHKRIKSKYPDEEFVDTITSNQRIHECPICFRVFGSGQALGGHKRSHITSHPPLISTKFRENLIDLNLPAPIEEDEFSQIEISAISDPENT